MLLSSATTEAGRARAIAVAVARRLPKGALPARGVLAARGAFADRDACLMLASLGRKINRWRRLRESVATNVALFATCFCGSAGTLERNPTCPVPSVAAFPTEPSPISVNGDGLRFPLANEATSSTREA